MLAKYTRQPLGGRIGCYRGYIAGNLDLTHNEKDQPYQRKPLLTEYGMHTQKNRVCYTYKILHLLHWSLSQIHSSVTQQ